MRLAIIGLAGALLAAGGATAASAQTMSYAEAGALLARNCGPDIEKFCAKVNLGGGALRDCLMAQEARINPACVADYKMAVDSLAKRAAAQAAVPSLCQDDARQYCQGVAPGNAHLITCLDTAKRVVGATCKQALTDAGWN